MTTIDFTHGGPHDHLAPGLASAHRSRARIAVGRIAGTAVMIAIGLALLALRYWLYLPSLHHVS